MLNRKITAIFLLTLLWSIITPIVALEIDEEEIKSVAADAVVFENYTGPHTVIDTLAQIKSIGSSLGNVIAPNPSNSTTAGNQLKYHVIHAVDSSITDGLDADILIIGEKATVDHIKNLRHIIAAYLVSAYGYSESDAQTLAVFVTVYNAVYRGKLDIFNARYKSVVTKNLTEEKAGLALNYKDWPGKSQIVIPLANTEGGLGTVDTTVISDKQVVDSMREEDDKGIDDRKALVDIKEREADEAAEKAATAQKEATKETVKQKEEEKKLTEAKKEAETAKKEAETARKEANENPNDKVAQQEAAKKEQIAEEKQEAVEEQQKKTDQQTEIAQEKRDEAAKQQAEADQKREEARIDRTEIAKDQQQLIMEGRQPDAEGVYGLKIIDDEFSAMVKLNKETGVVLKESPVTVVRGRTILPAGENYMAIAGMTDGNAAVKVVLLDKEYMEIIAESNEYASEKSVLIKDAEDYYAVIKDSNNWVIGKYNSELKLLLKSKIAVNPATPITINEVGICVTDTKGIARLLAKETLDIILETNNIGEK